MVPAATDIYTLSLHDALPISEADAVITGFREHRARDRRQVAVAGQVVGGHQLQSFRADQPDPAEFAAVQQRAAEGEIVGRRSEEHTSELQSRQYLVCRLLLEK